MSLRELLAAPTPNGAQVANYLDSLSPAARVEEVQSLPARLIPGWFESIRGLLNLEPRHLVSPNVTPYQAVRYAGINNMPAFRKFEKVFYRDPSGHLAGLNEQLWSFVTGPGYYTVTAGEDGELVFDYVNLPATKPDGFPAIKSNARGFATMVYGGMTDIVRGAASGVVLGKTFKGGKPRGVYFVLAQQGPRH